MEITAKQPPVLGGMFEFIVSGKEKPLRVTVFIGNEILMDEHCPDPPCHETIFLLKEVMGSHVRIVLQDSMSRVLQEYFAIQSEEVESLERNLKADAVGKLAAGE